MPSSFHGRLLAPAAVALALLVAPASAGATMVYAHNEIGKVSTLVVADDDGSNAHTLAVTGVPSRALPLTTPRISPDGTLVAAADTNFRRNHVLLVDVEGGPARTLLGANEIGDLRWSPDGRTLAAATDRGVFAIDAASGAATRLTHSRSLHLSFSPAGDRIAFDAVRGERSDVWTVPTAGGPATRLTADLRSDSPVWGPEAIAFERVSSKPSLPQTSQIWLTAPDGSGQRQLTPSAGSRGKSLSPVAWSADGAELLGNLSRIGSSTSWAVNPADGAGYAIAGRDVVHPATLSRDGATVLGTVGGFPDANLSWVVTVPYAGGAPTTIASHASDPDWNH